MNRLLCIRHFRREILLEHNIRYFFDFDKKWVAELVSVSDNPKYFYDKIKDISSADMNNIIKEVWSQFIPIQIDSYVQWRRNTKMTDFRFKYKIIMAIECLLMSTCNPSAVQWIFLFKNMRLYDKPTYDYFMSIKDDAFILWNIEAAAGYGNLKILQYIFKNCKTVPLEKMATMACLYAIEHNHMSVIKYIVEKMPSTILHNIITTQTNLWKHIYFTNDDPNFREIDVLGLCIMYNRMDILQYLINTVNSLDLTGEIGRYMVLLGYGYGHHADRNDVALTHFLVENYGGSLDDKLKGYFLYFEMCKKYHESRICFIG